MSCIIGLKHGGNVYIGADGRATTGDGEIRPVTCNKIFKTGHYLVGYCGSVRTGQLLRPENGFKPPKTIVEWPAAFRNHLAENGALLNDPETGDIQGANVLIGWKGKLFEILIDFQMLEPNEFSCIGSGSTYAFGAMEVLKLAKGMKPEDRIMKALEVSGKFCSQVGPPYDIKMI